MRSFLNKQVIKIRGYVLDHLLSLLWVHLVLDKWFKQTLCVKYFTELFLGSFDNVPDIKTRHYLLAIILGLMRDYYVMNH